MKYLIICTLLLTGCATRTLQQVHGTVTDLQLIHTIVCVGGTAC